jgi:hypothetical protein
MEPNLRLHGRRIEILCKIIKDQLDLTRKSKSKHKAVLTACLREIVVLANVVVYAFNLTPRPQY